MIDPTIRRIIAVDAHRRRKGVCPQMIHSLGTGETFRIAPAQDGFTDLETGLVVRVEPGRILLPAGLAPISIVMGEDVGFEGFDDNSGEHFSGRAGGGSSVTIYDANQVHYFQYAVVDERGL
jgi:streptogramin lyase